MNWILLKNSLLVAGFATAIAVALGFCAALWLCGVSGRLRTAGIVTGIVALMMPPFLVTNCWLHFLGHTGAWREWIPLNIFSVGGTVWILALMLWPISMLLVTAAWRRMDSSLMEADPMLSGVALIRWLLWPIARPAVVQASVITFVLAFSNFAVPAILQVKVLPADIWVSFSTTFDYVAGMKMSWPMIVAPLLLLWIFRKERVLWRAKQPVSAAVFAEQLGMSLRVCSGVAAVIAMCLSVGLPMSQLLFSAQTWSDFSSAIAAVKEALFYSVLFSTAGATCVVALALLLSRVKWMALSWVAFLVPGVLLGIALIWLFNRAPLVALYQSIGIVVLAFAIRYFAPAFTIVSQAVNSTDQHLAEMARMEGATRWQTLRYVKWPQVLLPVACAWYITYLLCLWDVETLVLVYPPGRETVALRIFNLLHYGHNSQVNVLCLVLLFVAVLPLLGIVALRTWNRRWFAAFAVAAALPVVMGCSASTGEDPANRFEIKSKIFSHVEVIGGRGTGSGQFNKPRSLTVDKRDNVFVVDMTGRVQKFSPEGVFLLSWQMPQTDLGRPKGMGTDSHGNIIVIEPHYSRVNHFAPDGQLQRQWGVHGTNDGQLAFPRAVAVNSRGEMLFSEYTITERIQRFSADSEFISGFGRMGNGPGEFNRAEGLAVDNSDRLYVTDSCNHRVQVFSSEGKFIRTHGKAGSGLGDLSYPYDVRVDASGLEFVCEFGNSRIQVFDEQGRTVETIGGAGAAPGQMANPWSIALDSVGNLYVADSQNHRVQKFIRRKSTQLAAVVGVKGTR